MPPRISKPCSTTLRNPRSCFSTTPLRAAARPKANPLQLLPKTAEAPPAYPYGPSHIYKQSNHGLYGNAIVQFGNNVAPESGVKTRRRWHPNIVHKQLFSRALGRTLRIKIRTRVLRTIDKVGGLDEYLLGGTPARLKELGEEGWKLRWAVINAPSMKRRIKEDRNLKYALGSMVESEKTEAARTRKAFTKTTKTTSVTGKISDTVEEEQEVEGTTVRRGIDVGERMQQHFEQSPHMQEQPAPQSLWQRITSPFRRAT